MTTSGHERNPRLTSSIWRRLVLGVIAWLLLGASLAAAQNFTWTGGGGTGEPHWSTPLNWEGGTVPSGTVGGLSFPAAACVGIEPNPCVSNNNVSGLHANALSIALGVSYTLEGDPLTLGAGGLSASTSSPTGANPFTYLKLPITLGASQTWSINGGPGDLKSDPVEVGGISGEADTLGIRFDNPTELYVYSDNEVGAASLLGSGRTVLGEEPSLHTVGSLDSTDGDMVSLGEYANLATFNGKTGPLVAMGHNTIQLGSIDAVGVLAVNGSMTLSPTSVFTTFIAKPGNEVGTDYAQLSATGNVSLAGASLRLEAGFSCPTLTSGEVDTLITTTGVISGTFANVPNGTVLPLRCDYAQAPTVTISYGTHQVTATVATAGGGERREPPELGRCTKVAGEKQGSKIVYHGGFTAATCLVASPTDSGRYEWEPGLSQEHFTISEPVGGTKVVCSSESGGGYYRPVGMVGVTLELSGCGSGGHKCTTPGLAEGDLKTTVLEGRLGWENNAKRKVGLALAPDGGASLFLEYGCGSSAITNDIGSILAPLQANRVASAFKLQYTTKKGSQALQQLEGEPVEVLMSSIGGEAFNPLTLKASLTLKDMEAAEINTAV